MPLEAPVDDGTTADTGRDRDIDDVLLTLAGAEAVFAKRGGVPVVVDTRRQAT